MEKRVEKIAKSVCEKQGVALYDFKIKNATKGLILAIFVTKIGGVTINECTKVSRNIADILEEEDFIDGKYYLEVSSPGLERSLEKKKHFVSAIGEMVEIVFAQESKNINRIGTLKEVLPEIIKIDVQNEIFEIKLKDIKKAKTYFDYKKNMKD